jgi:tellurite resistance protein TerC
MANLLRTCAWIAVAALFGTWIGVTRGGNAAGNYFAAYLLEMSLSIDNVFVFAVIFGRLHIREPNQHRVLLLGVLGAFVLRAVAIFAGISLLERFGWLTYPFAVLILFGAVRLLFGEQRQREIVEQSCDVCTTWIGRLVHVSPVVQGQRFFRRQQGTLVATPLLVALVMIETTDIVFALDSVPAVLSITREPLLAYSSNIMAMLGLRSLYFVLIDALQRLRYLRQGIAMLLVFTAVKMLSSEWIHIGPIVSICVVAGVLAVTTIASIHRSRMTVAP